MKRKKYNNPNKLILTLKQYKSNEKKVILGQFFVCSQIWIHVPFNVNVETKCFLTEWLKMFLEAKQRFKSAIMNYGRSSNERLQLKESLLVKRIAKSSSKEKLREPERQAAGVNGIFATRSLSCTCVDF